MQTPTDRPSDGAAASRNVRPRIDGWLAATSIYYVTSLLVAVGFSLGLYFVRPSPQAASSATGLSTALENYDARFYTEIARDGYFYDPTRGSTVALFPAYPMVGRAVAAVTRLPTVVAMLLVSNACFLASLALLWFYAHARWATAAPEPADWAVLSAALLPTGCFFRLSYSESAFFLISLLAMYGIERRWPASRVALLVGLATATRPVGIALLAPLALYTWREPGSRRARMLGLAWHSSVGCWGLIAYMIYQHAAFGEGLAFAKTQQHWGYRHAASAVERVAALARLEPIGSVYEPSSAGYWAMRDPEAIPWFSVQFANPIYFLGAGALIALGGWRRWLSAYDVLLGALLLLIPYVTRAYEMQMSSMARFATVVFPVYLVLGRLLACLPFAMAAALLSLSVFFLAAYAALYAAGYAVF